MDRDTKRQPGKFWENKSLTEMSDGEWESLCDGCAQCCLRKLEDAETGEVHYTDVSCRLLDAQTCRCTDYMRRTTIVPDCIKLRPDDLAGLNWMPDTCAYRLLYEGKPLPTWHPLISGDPDTVHSAGASIRDRTVSEEYVHEDDLHERVIVWRRDKSGDRK